MDVEREDELKELKIHSCNELPQFATLTLDNDCLERVVQSFGLSRWRGNGQYGFALEISRGGGQNLIVKVSVVNEDELRIGCELNSLIEETPVFPHAFGWLICHTIPNRWRAAVRHVFPSHEFLLSPPDRFLFTFIQPVEAGWNEYPILADHGCRITLFFLLHGLYVANQRLGFHHGDIHSGNVRVQGNQSGRRSATVTKLRFGQYEAEVTSELIPRFIDYGRSRTTRHNGDGAGSNDLRQLRFMFDEMLDIQKRDPETHEEQQAFYQFVASVHWDELSYRYEREGAAAIILPLLSHEYFNIPEIQRHQVKRQTTEPIQRCFSCCASNPPHQINHQLAPPKYFCHKRCYEKIHGICPFIK